jgi:hypothetical protein
VTHERQAPILRGLQSLPIHLGKQRVQGLVQISLWGQQQSWPANQVGTEEKSYRQLPERCEAAHTSALRDALITLLQTFLGFR